MRRTFPRRHGRRPPGASASDCAAPSAAAPLSLPPSPPFPAAPPPPAAEPRGPDLPYVTPVETQTLWLLGLANDFHLHSEELFRIYCHRDPQIERLTAALEGLGKTQEALLSNATDPPPAESTAPEDIAWRRCTVAYAYAGLLTAKATLRAQPALVAAVQMRLNPVPLYHYSPERGAYFKGLSATREVLDEATWKLREVAEHLTGPEPDLLKAVTGEFAHKAVRSAAVSQRPTTPKTAAEAAGPTATVVLAPAASAGAAQGVSR
ncbi:hypothetical protein [Kitasatospora sp. NPDC127116]|uniref:hypothetical protein n=1 Tax=Kitasatospora sp. NPDC127116 TaxID=3345367 RepID=UPI003629951C